MGTEGSKAFSKSSLTLGSNSHTCPSESLNTFFEPHISFYIRVCKCSFPGAQGQRS